MPLSDIDALINILRPYAVVADEEYLRRLAEWMHGYGLSARHRVSTHVVKSGQRSSGEFFFTRQKKRGVINELSRLEAAAKKGKLNAYMTAWSLTSEDAFHLIKRAGFNGGRQTRTAATWSFSCRGYAVNALHPSVMLRFIAGARNIALITQHEQGKLRPGRAPDPDVRNLCLAVRDAYEVLTGKRALRQYRNSERPPAPTSIDFLLMEITNLYGAPIGIGSDVRAHRWMQDVQSLLMPMPNPDDSYKPRVRPVRK